MSALQAPETALTLADEAMAIKITDQDSYARACEYRAGLQALLKAAITHHADVKSKAWAAHKAACDAETAALAPIRAAIGIIDPAITKWDAEEKRRADEERRLLEQAAREQAERMRQEAALEAIDLGAEVEEVDAIMSSPVVAAPIVMPKQPAPVAGVGTRKLPWAGRLKGNTDAERAQSFLKLVAHIAKHPEHIGLLKLNEPALNKMAGAMTTMLAATVPGVEAFQGTTVQVRR